MVCKRNKISSDRIEDIAVTAIKKFFFKSEIVEPCLHTKDKEPEWDGNFYLYQEKQFDNNHLIGRIPTQIKGKTVKQFKINNFSYSIKMHSLKAYLYEGVYYFVVQEITAEKTKKFYRELTPILLKNIIRAHKDQLTVSVTMYPLPSSIQTVEVNMKQFLIDCRKQVSFANIEPLKLKDLKHYGIHTLSLTTCENKQMPFPLAITQKPIYLYAKNKDKIEIPIDEGPFNIALKHQVRSPVKILDKEYYSSYMCQIDHDEITLSFGNCVKFILPITDKNRNITVTIEIKGNIHFLKDAICDAQFIIALAQAKQLKLPGKIFPIPSINNTIQETWTNYLRSWTALQKVLSMLNIHEDLDLSLIKKEDEQTIDILIAMIDENRELDLSINAETSSMVNLHLGNLYLWLLVTKTANGKYKMYNFFKNDIEYKVSCKYPDGQYKESIFNALSEQDLVECSNLPYNEVVPSYEKLKDKNPHIFERANALGLNLLKVVDKLDNNSIRKNDYLKCAETLFSWLMLNNKRYLSIYQLNLLQAHQRLGVLSVQDQQLLKELILSEDEGYMVKFGATVLSNDADAAQFYWKKLTKEDQDNLRSFPIWKLVKEIE